MPKMLMFIHICREKYMVKERKLLRKEREKKEKEIKNTASSTNFLLEEVWPQRKIYFYSFIAMVSIGGCRLLDEYTKNGSAHGDQSPLTVFDLMTQASLFFFTAAQGIRIGIQLNGYNQIDQLQQEWQEIKHRQRRLQAPAMQFLFGVYELPNRDRKEIVITAEEEKSLLRHEDKKETKNFLHLLHPGDACGRNVIRNILEFSDHLDPIVPKNI